VAEVGYGLETPTCMSLCTCSQRRPNVVVTRPWEHTKVHAPLQGSPAIRRSNHMRSSSMHPSVREKVHRWVYRADRHDRDTPAIRSTGRTLRHLPGTRDVIEALPTRSLDPFGQAICTVSCSSEPEPYSSPQVTSSCQHQDIPTAIGKAECHLTSDAEDRGSQVRNHDGGRRIERLQHLQHHQQRTSLQSLQRAQPAPTESTPAPTRGDAATDGSSSSCCRSHSHKPLAIRPANVDLKESEKSIPPSPKKPPVEAPAPSTPGPPPYRPNYIAVIGETGVGKSTFIRDITGSKDVIIGTDLESCEFCPYQ